MKEKLLKIFKISTLVTYILYVAESILIAGMFTNIILLTLALISSIGYVTLGFIQKKKSDIELALLYILSVISIVCLLY